MFWSTLTHISVPRRLSSGLDWFDWGICHLSQIDNCAHWCNFTHLDLASLCSGEVCFQREIAFFSPLSESRNNSQPDEERALPFQSLSAVWLMNYGWGYRLFSWALLHWPTLNSIPSWSETSWEMLSFPCACQPRVQKPTQTAEPSFVSLG